MVTVLTFNRLRLLRKMRHFGASLCLSSLSPFAQQICCVRPQIFYPALKMQACLKVRGAVSLMTFIYYTI